MSELTVELDSTRAVFAERADVDVKGKNRKLQFERSLGTVDDAFAPTDGDHGRGQIQLGIANVAAGDHIVIDVLKDMRYFIR